MNYKEYARKLSCPNVVLIREFCLNGLRKSANASARIFVLLVEHLNLLPTIYQAEC
jgi:hypothetical protein